MIRFQISRLFRHRLYSLCLTGLGYHGTDSLVGTGSRRRRSRRRQLHPIGDLSLLEASGLFQFSGARSLPAVVTADRGLLIICLEAQYIYVGSYLKDQRLAKLIGEPYDAT